MARGDARRRRKGGFETELPKFAAAYTHEINDITGDLVALIKSQSIDFTRKAGKNFQTIIQKFEDEAISPNVRMKVHEKIATQMRAAVLSAYETNVVQKQVASPYRKKDTGVNKRYTGGLKRTLREKTFAVGTPNGIAFMDVAALDRQARHWRRLNFGAGPAVGYEGVRFPQPTARLRFGGNQGIPLAFNDGPRENFSVPQKGFAYFDKNGALRLGNPPKRTGVYRKALRDETTGEYMHPTRGIRRLKSKPSVHGIGPRRFLDAGLVALGKEFGPAYKQHFDDAARHAAAKAKKRQMLKGATTAKGVTRSGSVRRYKF